MGHLSRRHGEQSVQVNGMLSSAVPVKSVGIASVDQRTVSLGVSEGERNALLEEMQQIKGRLHSTEQELISEKHARESQLVKVQTDDKMCIGIYEK